ncbi:MAG: YraN family protein [Acidobacteria bacterium]|nr:YraN family protein [Acidobacteriota bacterium]
MILARRGEDLAHRFVERELGWRVVARNFRHPARRVEIDLVAVEEGNTLVVAEVKTRSSAEISHPLRAFGYEKERNIGRGSIDWVRRAEALTMSVRFDVITVVVGGTVTIEHHRDVFHPLLRPEIL